MTCCVLANVGMLFLFRYSVLKTILVPLGMSFYVLQALGYVIDVYRKELTPEKNLMKYTVFLFFFPTIMSGPIQRGQQILPQIKEGRDFDYQKAHRGLYLLLYGYLLKIVVANPLGSMVNFAYDDYTGMPGATLLWATILYGIQLYCDFAGYSALAIGTGKLLGFDIKENFKQPYFAVSIKEFWNRWHISLSTWLRDYLYIPLGGNRKGKFRKYVNLMVTFLISGLWHGTGAGFLIWGGLHGIYQILGDCIRGRGKKQTLQGLPRILCGVFTFLLVDFAWLFFRAESLEQAVGILKSIFCDFGLKEMTYYGSYLLGGTPFELLFMFACIGVVFLIDFLHEKNISIENVIMCRTNIAVRWIGYIVCTLLILLVIVQNYGEAASKFIYTRF
ncbi:MBOAT family protein [Lachnospiraceae bacterium OttesenSCG-928-D06]|nr:MBOAT family protein [Lachnospiraceae bacterium OttesenSCG-928-D06]